MYQMFVIVGSLTMGFASYRIRKARIAAIDYHNAPRDMNILGALINDLMMAAIGYMGSHLLCCDYIYKHRQYVVERLVFERNNNFDRDTYDLSLSNPDGQNRLLKEYPFADFVS